VGLYESPVFEAIIALLSRVIKDIVLRIGKATQPQRVVSERCSRSTETFSSSGAAALRPSMIIMRENFSA
jgi:hypothetical protein